MENNPLTRQSSARTNEGANTLLDIVTNEENSPSIRMLEQAVNHVVNSKTNDDTNEYHPRPRGRAKTGYKWDYRTGKWNKIKGSITNSNKAAYLPQKGKNRPGYKWNGILGKWEKIKNYDKFYSVADNTRSHKSFNNDSISSIDKNNVLDTECISKEDHHVKIIVPSNVLAHYSGIKEGEFLSSGTITHVIIKWHDNDTKCKTVPIDKVYYHS